MTMVRVVHNRENPYVMLNKKALWDKNLSLEAVGLWARLLSRPDDWHISVKELIKSCGCGKAKIYRLFNELIKAGYAYRFQPRSTLDSKKTIYASFETHVFENKLSTEEIQKIFQQLTFQQPEVQVPENRDTTNIELTNPSSSSEEEVKEYKKKPKAPQLAAEAILLCDLLIKKLKERYPNFKQPKVANWEKDFDKLLRIDHRNLQEVEKLILWASENSFWKATCLSPDSLRDNYDKINAAMLAESEKSRIQANRQYAIRLRDKYPKELKDMSFDNKFAINRMLAKEISFNMEPEAFKEAFLAMFGGAYRG